MKKTLLLLAVLSFGSVCHAQSPTLRDGNALYDSCSGAKHFERTRSFSQVSGAEAFSSIWCMGYVAGVADTLDGSVVKVPANATPEQVIDIVWRFLDEHPELRAMRANVLIERALIAAFATKR